MRPPVFVCACYDDNGELRFTVQEQVHTSRRTMSASLWLIGFERFPVEFTLLQENGRAFVEMMEMYPSITETEGRGNFRMSDSDFVLFKMSWESDD